MTGFTYKRKFKHFCGKCVHFVLCSKLNVKNAQDDTDYCLWEKDYFKPLEAK